ncbi:MAG: tetratricopeptide repeat protein [Gammaproteobacteria bacterium]
MAINYLTKATSVPALAQTALVSSSLWLILLLLLLGSNAGQAADCGDGSGSIAIQACKNELARSSNSIDVRLRYADVLMRQNKYQQATDILGAALRMQPGNREVKQKLRLASSLADEKKSISNQKIKAPATGTSSSLNKILCKTLKGQRAINACNKVISEDPRNVTALIRRGDELLALNKASDAVTSYRLALAINPNNPSLQNKLLEADSRISRKKSIPVARKKAVTISSKPKQQKPSPQSKQTHSIAIAEVVPDELDITNTHPGVTSQLEPNPLTPQQYSNAPLSNGATF